MKIHVHHAIVSNHLILEANQYRHAIIPQNIYYKKKIYQICLFL